MNSVSKADGATRVGGVEREDEGRRGGGGEGVTGIGKQEVTQSHIRRGRRRS